MSNGQCYKLVEVESELLAPDLTVYLDLSVDERIARINNRNHCSLEDKQTLTEQANDELRSLYIGMCDGKPVGEWLMVDASKSVDIIVDNILKRYCKTV
ncbi:hypothetical protein [Vibrio diabolicus]|uniref:hypothetical protein n=1 Tax=Vibrio diabolicus TaxID=50719 RepID=UPI0021508D3E|nr:hypothetical protein [Vibrio diabolicus]